MKKSYVVMGVLTVLIVGLLASCGNKNQPNMMNQQEMAAMDHSKMVMINQTLSSEEAKQGEYVVSLVSGGMFKVAEDTLFSIYKGKKFYLLNEANKKLFDANPEKYVKEK